jgi:hypothetical protein
MQDINYLAVLVAALAQFAIGAVWYSPALFSIRWLRALGKTPESMQGMGKKQGVAFATSFVGSLLMSFVLANTVVAFNGMDAGAGAVGGFWTFVGFVFPVLLNGFLYDGSLRPNENRKTLFSINGGYYLVSLLVMGIILAVWR